MADETDVINSDYSLDDYFQASNVGSVQRAIGNNLYGINILQVPGAVPSAKIQQGYTFFTRPQLNFQTDNLRNDRKFYRLLTENSASLSRAIRCLLDPRLIAGYKFGGTHIPPISCPIMDNQLAFIPWLTNNIINISGWPDVAVPTQSSTPGLTNEVQTIVDGLTDNREQFDITATFRNTRGSPILAMMFYWERYASLAFKGDVVPYLDYIVNNRLDYNTRIYRLVMDQNKRFVEHIMATGAAFPISNATGTLGDFNVETVYSDQANELPIIFRANGFEFMDDILALEFNNTVAMFNPSMKDGKRASSLVKINADLKNLFNYRSYPYINTDTAELEWWVPKSIYENRSTTFLENNIGDLEAQDAENEGD